MDLSPTGCWRSANRLRVGRDRCTLFNTPLLVARLEALYEQMWDEYLSGRIPEPDLTNLAIYDEIGSELDHEAATHVRPADVTSTNTKPN